MAKVERGAGKAPRCPVCGSAQVLYRLRPDSYLCRRCGHQWPRPKKVT